MAIAARDPAAPEYRAQVRVQELTGKSLQRRADGATPVLVAGDEALLERAVPGEQVTRRDAERDEVARAIEAIPEIGEGARVAARIEGAHEGGGRRAHLPEHALEGAAEEIDPAVGQAGAQQRDDLAVTGVRVAEGKSDRVELDPARVIELAVEPLERLSQIVGGRPSRGWG